MIHLEHFEAFFASYWCQIFALKLDFVLSIDFDSYNLLNFRYLDHHFNLHFHLFVGGDLIRLVRITDHLLYLILSKHLQALIFQLQHQLCMYIQRSSCQFFCFLFFFYYQLIYGKDLLHRINQSFRYLFHFIPMEYMVESNLLTYPNQFL